MARRRWVWVDGRGLVEVDPDWRPTPRLFHIHGDTVEPFQSMATGEYFTSKSVYRADLKARGYEEVACSVESRLDAVRQEAANPKTPPLTMQELNARAEAIGFDWNKADPAELMRPSTQESGLVWE